MTVRATESGAIPGDGAGAASCAPVGAHRAILAGLHALERTGQAGVLAVVLRVSGSTYRKPGALGLLDAAGVRAGALSGGCLEADLERLARAVLDEGAARVVRFDTSGDEDRVFGTGSGCGGTSEVLLAPVPAAASPLRDALFAADARGLALELAFDEEGAVTGRGEARVAADVFRFDRDGTACVAAAATALLRVQVPAVRRSDVLRVLFLHRCVLFWPHAARLAPKGDDVDGSPLSSRSGFLYARIDGGLTAVP